MNEKKHEKWHQNKGILILLMFLVPPLGVYWVQKRDTKTWKKALYTFGAFYMLMVFILAIPINEKSSKKEFKHEQREEPYRSSEHTIVDKKADSISAVLRKQQIEALQKHQKALVKFQKFWADSVVRSWKGKYIINSINTPTEVQFELSKNATKSFNSNKEQSLPLYQSSFKKSFIKKFGSNYSLPNTKIDFIPNKELSNKNNPKDWGHPVLMNRGIKIYSGNQYYKEYLGKLSCKYKDPSNGMKYFVVIQRNGKRVMIEDYKFRGYWIKTKEANKLIGIGLSECY